MTNPESVKMCGCGSRANCITEGTPLQCSRCCDHMFTRCKALCDECQAAASALYTAETPGGAALLLCGTCNHMDTP